MRVAINNAEIYDVFEVLTKSSVAGIKNARENMVKVYKLSDGVKVGIIDGEYVAVWGWRRTSILSNYVYLWLLTVEHIETPFLFIRAAQMQVQELLKEFPVIVGDTDMNSPVSHRFLKLIGFKISRSSFKNFYQIERRA